MAEKLRRPAPFTPLSATFHTGRTGSSILNEFGLEGLAVWAAMLAEARHEQGLIVFRHEEDWGALGLAAHPPKFALKTFLTYLGRRKQTRTTRQGRVMYVELTQWGRWNEEKARQQSAWRMSRKRAQSERNIERTPEEHDRNASVLARALEPEPEPEDKPKALDVEEKQEQNGADPFRLASRYIDNTGWQDPHLEEELHERWPVLSSEEVAELIARARTVASRQEVA